MSRRRLPGTPLANWASTRGSTFQNMAHSATKALAGSFRSEHRSCAVHQQVTPRFCPCVCSLDCVRFLQGSFADCRQHMPGITPVESGLRVCRISFRDNAVVGSSARRVSEILFSRRGNLRGRPSRQPDRTRHKAHPARRSGTKRPTPFGQAAVRGFARLDRIGGGRRWGWRAGRAVAR